jgi:acetyltransferase-like isoleucine patch superfamily enzyme
MNTPKQLKVQIRNVAFGQGVTVIAPVNLYDCSIGDGCFIGPFVEIQKGVVIGEGTRVQSHSFICERVTIGRNCVIAHGVMFINDPYRIGGPAKGNTSLWQNTQIGNHVSIGSNSTILPVSICDNVVIGAGSVVTKNIDQPGIYAGNPARKLR